MSWPAIIDSPVYWSVAIYFVPLDNVILLAPEKLKVISVYEVGKAEPSNTSEVAKGLPVGTPDDPKVPECS